MVFLGLLGGEIKVMGGGRRRVDAVSLRGSRKPGGRKFCPSWRDAWVLVSLSVPNALTESGTGNVIYG